MLNANGPSEAGKQSKAGRNAYVQYVLFFAALEALSVVAMRWDGNFQ